MQYVVLAPLCVVQPLGVFASPRVGCVTSLVGIATALAAVSILPFAYPSAQLLLVSIAALVMCVTVEVDGWMPARSQVWTHALYASTGSVVTECKCGCAENDAKRALPGQLRRGHGGGGAHHARLDTGNSAPTTTMTELGEERLDTFEAGLQLVCYSSLVMWCLLVLVFDGSSADEAAWTNAAALSLTASAALYRLPINLKTQCVYVRHGTTRRVHTHTVHFLVLLWCVLAMTFSSIAFALRLFSNASDVGGYTAFVVALPLLLCALSPPSPCETVTGNAHRGLRLLHAAELYLYPWWYARLVCETAWWTWERVLALSGWYGLAYGAVPTAASSVGGVVTSSLAVAFAVVLAFDTVAFGWEELRAVSGYAVPVTYARRGVHALFATLALAYAVVMAFEPTIYGA